MSAIDLTTATAVYNWLGVGTSPPALMAAIVPDLITSCSADFLRELGRTDFYPATTYTEVRDGDGDVRMTMRHKPINAITSVTIAGVAIPASPDKIQAGYYIDSDIDPELVDQLWVNGGITDGAAVVVVYSAGYATAPADVSQVVTEWVADRYTDRTGTGKSSQRAAGGEHVSYEHEEDEIPPQVMRVIEKYQRTRPSVDKRKDDRDYRITKITKTTTEKISQ